MSLGKAMIHARKQKSIAKAAAYSGDYAVCAAQPHAADARSGAQRLL